MKNLQTLWKRDNTGQLNGDMYIDNREDWFRFTAPSRGILKAALSFNSTLEPIAEKPTVAGYYAGGVQQNAQRYSARWLAHPGWQFKLYCCEGSNWPDRELRIQLSVSFQNYHSLPNNPTLRSEFQVRARPTTRRETCVSQPLPSLQWVRRAVYYSKKGGSISPNSRKFAAYSPRSPHASPRCHPAEERDPRKSPGRRSRRCLAGSSGR